MTSHRLVVRPWLIALVILASSCSDPSLVGVGPGMHGLGAVVATNLNNCKLRKNTLPRIANVTDSLALVEYVDSPAAAVDSMLVARFRTDSGGWTPYWAFGALHHFSNYAVAW